jgi:hypothetical protein
MAVCVCVNVCVCVCVCMPACACVFDGRVWRRASVRARPCAAGSVLQEKAGPGCGDCDVGRRTRNLCPATCDHLVLSHSGIPALVPPSGWRCAHLLHLGGLHAAAASPSQNRPWRQVLGRWLLEHSNFTVETLV